jgi:hypothetical protein
MIDITLQEELLADTAQQQEPPKAAAAARQQQPSNDPWVNFPWPNDPNSNDPSFPQDPTIPPGATVQTILNELRAMLGNVMNFSTDPLAVQGLVQFMINIENDPKFANDPSILAFFQQEFPNVMSSGGQNLESAMADFLVLWSFGENGGDTTKTQSFIQALLGTMQGGSSNPITGSLYSELQYWNVNIGQLSSDYTQGGYLYYTNDEGTKIFCTGPNAQPNGLEDWMEYAGGRFGQFFSSAPQAGGDTIGQARDAIIRIQMDDLIAQYKKNPALLLQLLMLLIMPQKDDDYQSQLSGLGGVNKWLTEQSNSVGSIMSNTNSAYFNDPNNGQNNAKSYVENLLGVLNSTENYPNANALLGPVQSGINGILNLPATGANGQQTTLLALYQSGDYKDLAFGLANYTSGNGGPGVSLLDNLKQISTGFSNRSQAIGTQVSAISANDNQVINFLKGYLTDSTTGLTALEALANSNAKPS